MLLIKYNQLLALTPLQSSVPTPIQLKAFSLFVQNYRPVAKSFLIYAGGDLLLFILFFSCFQLEMKTRIILANVKYIFYFLLLEFLKRSEKEGLKDSTIVLNEYWYAASVLVLVNCIGIGIGMILQTWISISKNLQTCIGHKIQIILYRYNLPIRYLYLHK